MPLHRGELHHQKDGRCFYCGQLGHQVGDSLMISVFIDSGTDGNLINSLIRSLGLKTFLLPTPIEVNAIDGKPLGRITYCTQSVKLSAISVLYILEAFELKLGPSLCIYKSAVFCIY